MSQHQKNYQKIRLDGREVDGVGNGREIPFNEVLTLTCQRTVAGCEGELKPDWTENYEKR